MGAKNNMIKQSNFMRYGPKILMKIYLVNGTGGGLDKKISGQKLLMEYNINNIGL